MIDVSSESELQAAIRDLGSDSTIVIAPGTYTLSRTLTIDRALSNVEIRGATGNSADVTLAGRGMTNADYGEVPHGIKAAGVRGITIANLTVRDVYGHAILFEAGTSAPRVHNVRLVNAGQAFIKAGGDGTPADSGTVENSVIEATGSARGGGVEVAGGSNWTVRTTLFRNLRAPAGEIARPAVLVHGSGQNTIVEGNTFVGSQQEIAVGSADAANGQLGAVIRNNFILRKAGPPSGAAITVAGSPAAQIVHNTILALRTARTVIDVRSAGPGVVVRNNLLDGDIAPAAGARGTVADNYTEARAAMFADAARGDLHLSPDATAIMDRVAVLSGAPLDGDGEPRPQGGLADYGADEFTVAAAQALAPAETPPSAEESAVSASTLGMSESPAITVAAAAVDALPAPWVAIDIGGARPTGAATHTQGRFALEGGGAGTGGTTDEFHFVYQTLDGDGEIVARLDSLEPTDPWAKAGVMMRSELTANSPYAFVFVSSGNGFGVEGRTRKGSRGQTAVAGKGTSPRWLKLTRQGNAFTASTSTDGRTWSRINTGTTSMNRQLYMGLVVSSRSSATLATAVFTDVTTGGTDNEPEQPNVPPSVSVTSPANGATYTAPSTVPLSAAANDSDGSISQVDFYVGDTLVASDTTSPYSGSWSASAPGTYAIRASARDNDGGWTSSATVSVTVTGATTNRPPAVALTSPSAGATFTAPATIGMYATASDQDGSVSRVDFYAGSTLVASDTSSPYSGTWSGAAAGTHTLTAIARDNAGAWTTSAPIRVIVGSPGGGSALSVALTSPTNGASFSAPATLTLTASASGGGSVSSAAAGEPGGLVSRWTFDERSGTVASDTQGRNTGSLMNGASWTAGKLDGAVRLDGQTQYVALPNLDVSGSALTVSAWVFNSAFPKGVDQRIISKSSGTAEQSHYWMLSHTNNQTRDGSNRLRFRLKTGGRTTTLVASSGNLPLNAWYHAAATYDGSRMRLYLNGVEVGSASKTGAINTSAAVPVSLGRSPEGSNYLAGAIDDVRIYNRALSTAELQTVMQNGSGGDGGSDSGSGIAAVEFYSGSTRIGTDTTSPYSMTWSNVPAGSYVLTAVARDSTGASASSAKVNVTVSGSSPAPSLPRLVVFDASADHSTKVTSYTVEFFAAGANPSTSTPVRIQNIGKPTPVNGEISVDVAATVQALPAGTYFVTVCANGSGGSSRSTPTEQFVR